MLGTNFGEGGKNNSFLFFATDVSRLVPYNVGTLECILIFPMYLKVSSQTAAKA